MESPLYIINEYGILRKILSNLNNKDLCSASEVCRLWKKIARSLMISSSQTCSYLRNEGLWPDFNNKIQPSLILHMSSQRSRQQQHLFLELGAILKGTYNIVKSKIIAVSGSKFITSSKQNGVWKICYGGGEQPEETVILIPEYSGLKVHVDYLKLNIDYLKSVAAKVSQQPGFILVISRELRNQKLADKFMSFIPLTSKVKMGGGICETLQVIHQPDMIFEKASGFVLSFSGKSVKVHVDIIASLTANLNEYFSNMRDQLGPVPQGHSRIAFIFSCVNRHHAFEYQETECFSKFFPGIPVYGFWSLGEFYFHGSDSDVETGCLRPDVFRYYQATVYLIVTFQTKGQCPDDSS